ncbi:DUF1491 family protein [Roseomonas sp. CCTCC AB2023176]|uniref:DUF1491 family protein n=1 Tax=Roseomonas sp. CCTCC AB2023176 TaxID=3342640 RepID=UPI0035D7ECBD
MKSALWVSAAVRLSDGAGRPAAVLRRGDPDSGGILCVLRGRGGLTVLAQARDAAGREAWVRGTGATPVTDDVADAYVERQVRRDPDLWVVEFEAPDGLPLRGAACLTRPPSAAWPRARRTCAPSRCSAICPKPWRAGTGNARPGPWRRPAR